MASGYTRVESNTTYAPGSQKKEPDRCVEYGGKGSKKEKGSSGHVNWGAGEGYKPRREGKK